MQEVLPDATIVIDRFHVARHYRDGVDALRKQEVRRLKKELLKKHMTTSHTRCKREADLDAEEQACLDSLFAHSPIPWSRPTGCVSN